MTDRNSLRIPRARQGAPRNSSARSSALYDDVRQPSITHALRPSESRFSLNEQFATSRREYEFGYDDASLFDRATLASDVGDGSRDKDGGGWDEQENYEQLEWDADCYDILCLPWDRDLTPDQIRQAYYRMFLLFYPDNYPENLRSTASYYFSRVQEAFETLIDPERRAIHDAGRVVEKDGWAETPYDIRYQQPSPKHPHIGTNSASNLGIRFNTTRGRPRGRKPPAGRNRICARPLDFVLSHAITANLPTWKNGKHRSMAYKSIPSSTEADSHRFIIEIPCPTMTVSGSVYGVVEEMSRVPITLLSERYQPLSQATRPNHPIVDLGERKMSPLMSVMVQQDFLNGCEARILGRMRWIKSSVGITTDVLPEPSITTHFSHGFTLPNTERVTTIDASIGSSTLPRRAIPRTTLGVRHRLRCGTAFIHADSGDWLSRSGETCRFFDEFSTMTRKLSYAEFPLTTEPNVEVGFTTGEVERSAPSALHGGRGPKELDGEISAENKASWTVSAQTSFTSTSGFVRYSKDITKGVLSFFRGSPARLEAELCTTIFHDRYLALRSLWSVGVFSKIGLEVGLSTHNIHLSAHWSRHGQRITIPVLIAQHAFISSKVLLWAGALSALSFGIPSLLLHLGRRWNTTPPADPSSIARHLHHADTITALLAPAVDALQKHRASQGGVVVLSAKFGVQDDGGSWAGEEVADVTVAVAALVPSDGAGRVVIAEGVRKGRLPGFWDPAPGREKVLHVRYSWKGREAVVEVRGRDELALPA